MDLAVFLQWLMTLGSGVLAYMAVDRWGCAWTPVQKRIAAAALSSAIAILAYLAQYAMAYIDAPPDTWRVWVETLFSVAASSFGLSQLIHGVRDLGK